MRNGGRKLPGAAIRYVLDDDRFQQLVIGMRTRGDLEANIKTFSGDVTCTEEGPVVARGIRSRGDEKRRRQEDEGGVTSNIGEHKGPCREARNPKELFRILRFRAEYG